MFAKLNANSVPKLSVEFSFFLLGALVVDVVIISSQLIDGTLGGQFNDAVGYSIDELMVVRGKQNISLE